MKTHAGSRVSLLDCSVVSGKREPWLPSTGDSEVPLVGGSVGRDSICSHGTASSKMSCTDCFEFPGSGSSVVCPNSCCPFMLKPNDVTILKIFILTDLLLLFFSLGPLIPLWNSEIF